MASIAVILLLTANTPALAQQKTTPPSPHSQAQLEDRVKELETRLNAAEQKAAIAAMEKDYITRTQRQYETYYQSAFNTQVWVLSITGFTLATLFFLAGRFGFGVFTRQIDSALKETSAQLRTEFVQMLSKETQALREGNAAQVKRLEEDLQAQADFDFQFSQGMSQSVGRQYDDARFHFRNALDVYRNRKPRQPMEKQAGAKSCANIFASFKAQDPAKFEEDAKKELATERYNDLVEELALAALDVPELAPLLKEKK